jgi:hypothetical protein
MTEILIRPDEEIDVDDAGYAPSSAELAECNCPEFCERDHENE